MKTLGFTMAEILITIGIIGIVASMTLPGVLGHYKEKATVTQLKRTYSILSNAFNLAIYENGPVSSWYTESDDFSTVKKKTFNNISKYLNIVKYCENLQSGCYFDGYIKNLKSEPIISYNIERQGYKMILSDGTMIQIANDPNRLFKGCNLGKSKICDQILVDINGKNRPNTKGVDIFLFYITDNGIIPCGLANDGGYNNNFLRRCNINSQIGAASEYGDACAGWVLTYENMNYLHCSDLNWDGNKKCD